MSIEGVVEMLEMQLKLLPIRAHAAEEYVRTYQGALREMAGRDPEDAHALALARHLGLSLWSNDRDLDGFDVQCFTTARLLAFLERTREGG